MKIQSKSYLEGFSCSSSIHYLDTHLHWWALCCMRFMPIHRKRKHTHGGSSTPNAPTHTLCPPEFYETFLLGLCGCTPTIHQACTHIGWGAHSEVWWPRTHRQPTANAGTTEAALSLRCRSWVLSYSFPAFSYSHNLTWTDAGSEQIFNWDIIHPP